MSKISQRVPARRLLIVMPTWIGDAVMATPTLRALRQLYPQAQITAMARPLVRPMVDACPWVDRIVTIRPPRKGMLDGRRGNLIAFARRLAAAQFDTAVLLPNSFRSALLVRMAGIPRRVGYERDGRGFLLTDRLLPRRVFGKFVPVPTREYYLGLAHYLGSVEPDATMQLFTRPEHDARVDQILRQAGVDSAGGQKLVLLTPGANFGDAKMWYPDRFAAVADRCTRELNAIAAIIGSPKERPILDQVLGAAKERILDLPALGVDLALLKSIVGRSSLMIANDTGPRHIAAALGVPVVTIFGPTDPAWTEINFELERKVRVDVFCGPCQKKRCPLDHRCMKLVEPQMVFEKVTELTRSVQPSA